MPWARHCHVCLKRYCCSFLSYTSLTAPPVCLGRQYLTEEQVWSGLVVEVTQQLEEKLGRKQRRSMRQWWVFSPGQFLLLFTPMRLLAAMTYNWRMRPLAMVLRCFLPLLLVLLAVGLGIGFGISELLKLEGANTTTVIGTLNGTVDGVINGTVHGAINGTVNTIVDATITGLVKGVVNGLVNSKDNSTFSGNVNGAVDGIVKKGAINGIVDARINGNISGFLNGSVNSVINGTIKGGINGLYNGSAISTAKISAPFVPPSNDSSYHGHLPVSGWRCYSMVALCHAVCCAMRQALNFAPSCHVVNACRAPRLQWWASWPRVC